MDNFANGSPDDDWAPSSLIAMYYIGGIVCSIVDLGAGGMSSGEYVAGSQADTRLSLITILCVSNNFPSKIQHKTSWSHWSNRWRRFSDDESYQKSESRKSFSKISLLRKTRE